MKLLLISDLAATGFGRVGRELMARFIEAGIDLRAIGINYRGLAGELAALIARGADTKVIRERLDTLDAEPFTKWILPAASVNPNDGMGHLLVPAAISGGINAPNWTDWKPDMVLAVADPRAMGDKVATSKGAFATLPVWNYVPIEGVSLPPVWRGIWENVDPVAMSDFGQEQLQNLLGRDVPVAYHGVSAAFHEITPSDPGTYRGKPITTKDQAKAAFGWQGRTVLLRTDRFVRRKNYPALISSMIPVLEAHPEALLVIHCAPDDEGGSMAEQVSRIPGSFSLNNSYQHPQVRLTQAHDTFRGLSDDDLNVLYNAADIYVSTTMAEGFGLTLAEAAACAVPVVATDYSAVPEVLGAGGVLARVEALYDNEYGSRAALVDQSDFSQKVSWLIEHPAKRREIGQAGKRHVQKFDWNAAANVFIDLFEAEADKLARAA